MANNLWVGAVRKGLSTAKPTVPDFPSDTFGFFYETDTGDLYFGESGGGEWLSASSLGVPSGSTVTAASDVTAAYATINPLKLTLTLDGIVVAVADADDFGSAELCTLPDKNLLVIGCEVDLELVKDGVGFINTTDLDVALGTAAASNTTLATTMLNILPKVDLDASDLSPALASHSLATTPVLTGVQDGATNKVYLNVSGTTETGEAATITATGTVEIYLIDLGNTTS
jgi:hypothetical protein